MAEKEELLQSPVKESEPCPLKRPSPDDEASTGASPRALQQADPRCHATILHRANKRRVRTALQAVEATKVAPLSWPAGVKEILDASWEVDTADLEDDITVLFSWSKLTEEVRSDLSLMVAGEMEALDDSKIEVPETNILLITDERFSMEYHLPPTPAGSISPPKKVFRLLARDLRGPLLYLPKGHHVKITFNSGCNRPLVFKQRAHICLPRDLMTAPQPFKLRRPLECHTAPPKP